MKRLFFNREGEWSPVYKVRLWAKFAICAFVAFAAGYIGIRIAEGGAGWAMYAFFWIIAVLAMIRALRLVFKLQQLWEYEHRLFEEAQEAEA